jgi:hypothetical protein
MGPLDIYRTADGHEFPGHITPDGQIRLLACLPSGDRKLALPSWTSANPIIPQSEWVEFDDDHPEIPILDQGQTGCHSEDTEVLTDRGWIAWPNVKGGMLLGTMNPLTHALEFQAPLALHAYDYDGPLYHSSNQRLDFALTPGHRMFVRKWDQANRCVSGDYRFTEMKDLGWYSGLAASTSGFIGVNVERLSIEDGREYLGDDFVALMAVVASDGWAGGTENTKDRVGFCCFNENRYDKIASLAHRIGFIQQEGRKGVWHKTDATLAEWFRTNGYTNTDLGARNKRVPQIVKTLGQRQVSHFLEHFGDQCTSHENRWFYSSSPRLIDDLQDLLLRVGRRGSIMEREPRSTKMKDGRFIDAANCGTEYSLVEWNTDRLSIDRKKNVEQDDYKGTVFCATVPNSLLITRRNKSVLISGNSCVGHGSATAMMFARATAGMQFQALSACFLYGLINGGRDQGANISDAMTALMQTGICLESEVPEGQIYSSRFPATAKQTAARFKIEAAYTLSSWEEVCSAVQLRFVVSQSVFVGGQFNNLDANGCPPAQRGSGNHCVFQGSGAKKLSTGEWINKGRNSWGTRWGLNGRFNTRQAHIDNQSNFDGFALQVAYSDPSDPTNPPTSG